ncbi:uncharacterized protein LOC144125754 isoform X2 [Amblyomma americanum]
MLFSKELLDAAKLPNPNNLLSQHRYHSVYIAMAPTLVMIKRFLNDEEHIMGAHRNSTVEEIAAFEAELAQLREEIATNARNVARETALRHSQYATMFKTSCMELDIHGWATAIRAATRTHGLNEDSALVNDPSAKTKSLELVGALEHKDVIHLLPLIDGVENLNITEVTSHVGEESIHQLCLQLLKNRRLRTLFMTDTAWRHVPPAMLDDLTDILEMHNCPADIGGASPQMFSLRYWHEMFAMNVENSQFVDADTDDNDKFAVTPFGAHRRVASQEWNDVYDYHRQIYTTAIALLHNKMVPIDDFVHLCMYEQHYVVRVKGIISNGYFKLHSDIIAFLASQKQEAALKTMEDSKSYIVTNALSRVDSRLFRELSHTERCDFVHGTCVHPGIVTEDRCMYRLIRSYIARWKRAVAAYCVDTCLFGTYNQIRDAMYITMTEYMDCITLANVCKAVLDVPYSSPKLPPLGVVNANE